MLKDLFNSTYYKRHFLYFLPLTGSADITGDTTVILERSSGQKAYPTGQVATLHQFKQQKATRPFVGDNPIAVGLRERSGVRSLDRLGMTQKLVIQKEASWLIV
jgi:hypothetical protein